MLSMIAGAAAVEYSTPLPPPAGNKKPSCFLCEFFTLTPSPLLKEREQQPIQAMFSMLLCG